MSKKIGVVLELLVSGCSFNYPVKAWKKEILDLFYDNDFFQLSKFPKEEAESMFQKWRHILCDIVEKEKSTMPDFLKILSNKLSERSPILFSTRNSEVLNKARFLKRLSFLLFCGKQNEHVQYLTTIHEKLSEALKLSPNRDLIEQIFLCLRVCLLRFSSENLRSIWPLVLTETIRILTDSPSDKSMIFSVCKFLDFAIVLSLEEFNTYEWMFLTDYLNFPLKNQPVYQHSYLEYLIGCTPPKEILKEQREMMELENNNNNNNNNNMLKIEDHQIEEEIQRIQKVVENEKEKIETEKEIEKLKQNTENEKTEIENEKTKIEKPKTDNEKTENQPQPQKEKNENDLANENKNEQSKKEEDVIENLKKEHRRPQTPNKQPNSIISSIALITPEPSKNSVFNLMEKHEWFHSSSSISDRTKLRRPLITIRNLEDQSLTVAVSNSEDVEQIRFEEFLNKFVSRWYFFAHQDEVSCIEPDRTFMEKLVCNDFIE